jgi:hypothetical protein
MLHIHDLYQNHDELYTINVLDRFECYGLSLTKMRIILNRKDLNIYHSITRSELLEKIPEIIDSIEWYNIK